LTDILEIFPNIYNFDLSTRFLAWIAALPPSVNWGNRQLPNLLVGNENDLFIMVTLSASTSSYCFVCIQANSGSVYITRQHPKL
jgi:hypothetical protein